MIQPDLDSLIIKHLVDIDRTAMRLNVIEEELFAAMAEMAEDWAEKASWAGDCSYHRGGGWDGWDFWIAPSEWRTRGPPEHSDEFDAWFALDVGAGDTEEGLEGEDWFYVTRLCGIGFGKVGLRFVPDGVAKRRQWKQSFGHVGQMVAGTPFEADARPSLFLPIKLNQLALVEALKDEDLAAALDPFKETLNALLAAKSAFDQVVQFLRSREIPA